MNITTEVNALVDEVTRLVGREPERRDASRIRTFVWIFDSFEAALEAFRKLVADDRHLGRASLIAYWHDPVWAGRDVCGAYGPCD